MRSEVMRAYREDIRDGIAHDLGRRKLPFAPFEDALRREGYTAWRYFPATTYQRYRAEGMPLDAADKYAIRLGYHPAEIWGRGWWET